jgi:transcriptional regulator with XRE-family HTH domain
LTDEEIPFEVMSARMGIAHRLRQERRYANLTRIQMAERLYVSVSDYRKMETTAYPFTWLLVKWLAHGLEIEPSKLAPEYCALSFHTS